MSHAFSCNINMKTTSLNWIKVEIVPFLVNRHYNLSAEIKNSLTWLLFCMKNNWSHGNGLWCMSVCVGRGCSRTRTCAHVPAHVWAFKCSFSSWMKHYGNRYCRRKFTIIILSHMTKVVLLGRLCKISRSTNCPVLVFMVVKSI